MDKGKLMGVFAVLILAVTFVFAASSVLTTNSNNLQVRGNFSDTMNVSVYTTLNFSSATALGMNASIYYNATGGQPNGTSGTFLLTIFNGSDNRSLENATVRIAGLGDNESYNFTILVDNGTDQEWIVGIKTVRIGNVPPNTSAFIGIASNENLTDSITLNVTADDLDDNVSSVFFNITNGTGQVNYTLATGSGISYSLVVNTTLFLDGTYNITAWANDSLLNNMNSTRKITTIVFDNTDPAANPTCTDVQSGDAFPCTCAGTDATAGVNSTTGSSTSPDGTATPTSTGTFTYTCTVTDYSSNSNSASTTYSVTSQPGGSSSGGGGSTTTNYYTKTIPKSGNEFSTQGTITQDLKVKERIKLLIDGDTHYIGIREIIGSKVTMEVTSEPQLFDLTAGQSKKIDSDKNGVYDMHVELVSVTGSSVRIKTYSISETVPEIQEDATDDVVEDNNDKVTDDKKGSSKKVWIWLAVILVVLAVLIALWVRRK